MKAFIKTIKLENKKSATTHIDHYFFFEKVKLPVVEKNSKMLCYLAYKLYSHQSIEYCIGVSVM